MHGSLESRRPGGAWHAAPLPSAGGDGDRWLLVRPVRTTEYRLAAGSVSTTPVRIAVSPRVVVARDRHQLSGSVRPALGGLRVAIQRRLAGSWLTIRRARLREAGDFSLDRDLPPGTYRATIEPTSGLAAAFSSPIRVP